MASPFAIFRKNQKAMYALLAILCMVGFSIGGAVDLFSNQTRGGTDPVVATAYGKSIHASEVQGLRRNKITAINFVDLAQRAELGFTDSIDQNTYEYFMNNLLRRNTGIAYFGPPTEESVVRTWVLDERARQMGMVISDAAINKFLHDVTHDKVKPEVFGDIARQLNVSQPQLFEALRGELMSLRLQEMALGRPQTTPAQRWDYYRRQKQRATVELAAVPVETLVGEVPDATDEELKAFFEKHKEQEPDPESPTPGFKVPQKADFQLVIAKFSDFYDEKSVTEEEIKKRYEEFKDTRYLWEQFDTEEADEPEAPAATEKTNDGQPADEKPSAGKEADGKPADDKSADEKPADKGDEPATRADDRSQSSLFWNKELVNLVRDPSAVMAGLLAADEATENEKSGGDEKPADKAGSSPGDVAGKDSGKTAVKNGARATGEGDADDAKKTAGDTSSGKDKTAAKKSKSSKPPAIAPQITDEFVLHRDIREGPHPKHAPLWRVEDVIRKELAREKANKKMQEALDPVRSKMRTFARKMGPDDTEEKMPDLDKFAAAQGLSEVETGLLTARKLREKFPELAEARGEEGGASFVIIAYGGMAKFQSKTVLDIEGNRYLAWKVEDKDAYVPDFVDVRSEVLRDWKRVKARDLALKKAQELADEANKQGKPLKELFAGRDDLAVQQPPAFSWLTRGIANADNRSPLTISEVEGVDHAGPGLMREIFNLSVRSAGAALNEPQTVAYVVRLVSLDPPPERLRNTFMADDFSLYNEVANADIVELQRAWLKGIEAEARLTWKEKTDENIEQ